MTTSKPTKNSASNGEGELTAVPGPDRSEMLAKLATRPSINAAAVMVSYSSPLGIAHDDLGALMDQLGEDVKDVWAGDMTRAEAILFGQAHALQAIFMNLARRATAQNHMKNWEAYLRMAMKAQNQCRMTLETLATIKNPPVVFARQANINNGGQQQINNRSERAPGVASAQAAFESVAHDKIPKQQHGERLDVVAARPADKTASHLAPMAKVQRTASDRRL